MSVLGHGELCVNMLVSKHFPIDFLDVFGNDSDFIDNLIIQAELLGVSCGSFNPLDTRVSPRLELADLFLATADVLDDFETLGVEEPFVRSDTTGDHSLTETVTSGNVN